VDRFKFKASARASERWIDDGFAVSTISCYASPSPSFLVGIFSCCVPRAQDAVKAFGLTFLTTSSSGTGSR